MEPMLKNFFVFRIKLDLDEDKIDEKLLYYYPKSEEIEIKRRTVGLAEAMMNFIEGFTDEDCQYLITTQTCQLFKIIENNICLVMTILNDIKKPKPCIGLYKTVLETAYKTFCFFHDNVINILKKCNNDFQQLRSTLEYYYDRYLANLQISTLNIITAEGYMKLLCLDKNNFMKVYCTMNRLTSLFTNICYTSLLFHDEVVWSGVNEMDMHILYHYATTYLLPKNKENEMASAHTTSSNFNNKFTQKSNIYGKYLRGPKDLNSTDIPKLPVVHLNTDGKKYQLVVYTALSCTIFIIINGEETPGLQWFKNIYDYLNGQLTGLATNLHEEWNQKHLKSTSQNTLNTTYIYINGANLSTQLNNNNRHLIETYSSTISEMHYFCKFNESPYNQLVVQQASNDIIIAKRKDNDNIQYVVFANNTIPFSQLPDEFQDVLNTDNFAFKIWD